MSRLVTFSNKHVVRQVLDDACIKVRVFFDGEEADETDFGTNRATRNLKGFRFGLFQREEIDGADYGEVIINQRNTDLWDWPELVLFITNTKKEFKFLGSKGPIDSHRLWADLAPGMRIPDNLKLWDVTPEGIEASKEKELDMIKQ